jgi:hypothetical protein
VGDVACSVFDSATGGVSTVVFVGGVDDDKYACECAEGVEGAGCGVCMRWTGGVCECTMGGVCPMARLTGTMGMCGCEETTTGDA